MLLIAEEVQRVEEALKKDDRPPTRPAQERARTSSLLGVAEALQGVESRERQGRLQKGGQA